MTVQALMLSNGVISWKPDPVGEQNGVGFHCEPVLVTVPAEACVSLVLDVKHPMSEARFPKHRVVRLWLRHPIIIRRINETLFRPYVSKEYKTIENSDRRVQISLTRWTIPRGSLRRQLSDTREPWGLLSGCKARSQRCMLCSRNAPPVIQRVRVVSTLFQKHRKIDWQ